MLSLFTTCMTHAFLLLLLSTKNLARVIDMVPFHEKRGFPSFRLAVAFNNILNHEEDSVQTTFKINTMVQLWNLGLNHVATDTSGFLFDLSELSPDLVCDFQAKLWVLVEPVQKTANCVNCALFDHPKLIGHRVPPINPLKSIVIHPRFGTQVHCNEVNVLSRDHKNIVQPQTPTTVLMDASILGQSYTSRAVAAQFMNDSNAKDKVNGVAAKRSCKLPIFCSRVKNSFQRRKVLVLLVSICF
mmetsp:Transcript_28050/g.41300  ORF Transcript_28050/g.41300 Transcript_28050/m.41300 type:complete len:243 (+) Transcript_28050:352-1080(+)